MTHVAVWRLFAFMDDDPDGHQDETRAVADWQLEDVIRWCRFRGYDHIYISRSDTTRFEKAAPVAEIVHRFGAAA